MLDALRKLDGGTGAAVSGYLDLVGYRLLDGFDISNPFALEMPDALLRAIRVAAEGIDPVASDVDAKIAEVRGKVAEPESCRVRQPPRRSPGTYRIRDERGVFSDIWASGLDASRGLAGGRRLAAKGRIHDATHFVDAGIDEDEGAAASGTNGPSADELAEARGLSGARTTRRTSRPRWRLPPPAPAGPVGTSPAAGRMARAIGVALGARSAAPMRSTRKHMLRGSRRATGFTRGPRGSSPVPRSSGGS